MKATTIPVQTSSLEGLYDMHIYDSKPHVKSSIFMLLNGQSQIHLSLYWVGGVCVSDVLLPSCLLGNSRFLEALRVCVLGGYYLCDGFPFLSQFIFMCLAFVMLQLLAVPDESQTPLKRTELSAQKKKTRLFFFFPYQKDNLPYHCLPQI